MCALRIHWLMLRVTVIFMLARQSCIVCANIPSILTRRRWGADMTCSFYREYITLNSKLPIGPKPIFDHIQLWPLRSMPLRQNNLYGAKKYKKKTKQKLKNKIYRIMNLYVGGIVRASMKQSTYIVLRTQNKRKQPPVHAIDFIPFTSHWPSFTSHRKYKTSRTINAELSIIQTKSGLEQNAHLDFADQSKESANAKSPWKVNCIENGSMFLPIIR